MPHVSTTPTHSATTHRTKKLAVIASTALTFFAAAGQSQATVIDFELQSLNTSIANQYAALGVTFSSPGNPTEPTIGNFSGNSTTGNLLADFSTVGGIQLDAFFLSPVTSVSALAYANPSYDVTMRAYDSSNNLLGTASIAALTFNHGTLALSGIGAISKVSWSTGSDIAAVGIDNLTFPSASVPVSSTLLLLSLGVLPLAGLKRWVRRTA